MVCSRLFFGDRVSSVQINDKDGTLQQIYFPTPGKNDLKMETSILTADIDTSTNDDKLRQFVQRSGMLINALIFTTWLHSKKLFRNTSVYDLLKALPQLEQMSLLIAFCNAWTMLISLEYQTSQGQPVHHAHWCGIVNTVFGSLQFALCVQVFAMHLVNRFPLVAVEHFNNFVGRDKIALSNSEGLRMLAIVTPSVFLHLVPLFVPAVLNYVRYESGIVGAACWVAAFVPLMLKRIRKYCENPQSLSALIYNVAYELLLDSTTIFNLLLILCSALGLFYQEWFYTFHLFKAITIFPQMLNVLKAVLLPSYSLLLVLALTVIVVYCFSILSFFNFKDLTSEIDEITLWENFFSLCQHGVIDGRGFILTGFQADYTDSSDLFTVLLQFLFWLMIAIVLLNCVFGLMIDTFVTLREDQEKQKENLRSYCFICCLHRSEFDTLQEFEMHKSEEHNQMNYLFYINYVRNIEKTERNGIEDFVQSMVDKGEINRLPLGARLSSGAAAAAAAALNDSKSSRGKVARKSTQSSRRGSLRVSTVNKEADKGVEAARRFSLPSMKSLQNLKSTS